MPHERSGFARKHVIGESWVFDNEVFVKYPLPSWIYDLESLKVVAVNRAACRAYGYSKRDFLTMRVPELLSTCARLDAAPDSSAGRRFHPPPSTCHRTKGGNPVSVAVSWSRIQCAGRPACLAVFSDATFREKLQLDLRLFTGAVAAAGESIMITDANLDKGDPKITFVNAAFTKMTGYAPGEVIGKTTKILQGPKTERIPLRRIRQDLALTGAASYQSVNYRKDGSEYIVEWRVAPLQDEAGSITHLLSLQRDVTERLRLQEQFLQAQKMEAVGRLAGGIAHDFNNLLTVILGYAGLLANEMEKAQSMSEKETRSLAEIQKAAEKAADLTGQLLAFSRKQTLRSRVVELNSVVVGMESLLRRLLGEDLDLELHLDPSLGLVQADPVQVQQALMNLAVNARDAMPRGGLLIVETRNVDISPIYADVGAIKPGRYVVLAVTDTGEGMDDHIRAQAFEPFFTTKEAGHGTGLGLSMVHGFAKQSGGHVSVYSEPGKGACFKIYLPRSNSAMADRPSREVQNSKKGSGVVLAVEDDPGIRELIREVLSLSGYEVFIAANASDAISISQEIAVDVLLTDVVLPGTSGPELAEILKAARPTIKVLFSSGYSDHALFRQGILDQGSNFVQKPFDTETLCVRINDLLVSSASSSSAA